MNTVAINGNVTRDPEIVAPNGSEYTLLKFSIANNDESKKNANGEYEDVVSFFDVNYWTKNPTLWCQKIQKGIGVLIEGQLKQDRWQDDNGNTRSRVIINLKRGAYPIMLASKDSPAVPSPQNGHNQGGSLANSVPSQPAKDDYEDDIPF